MSLSREFKTCLSICKRPPNQQKQPCKSHNTQIKHLVYLVVKPTHYALDVYDNIVYVFVYANILGHTHFYNIRASVLTSVLITRYCFIIFVVVCTSFTSSGFLFCQFLHCLDNAISIPIIEIVYHWLDHLE